MAYTGSSLFGFLPSLGYEFRVGVKLQEAAFLATKASNRNCFVRRRIGYAPKNLLRMSSDPALHPISPVIIVWNKSLDHGTCAFGALHGFVCHICPRILQSGALCHAQAVPCSRPSRRIESPQPFGSNRRISLNLSRSRSKDAMRYPPFAARAANQASAKSTFLESNRFKASMTTSASAVSTPAL